MEDELKWKCCYCGKGFRLRWELIEHKHNGCSEKPEYHWICKYCGNEFETERKLRSHLESCELRPPKRVWKCNKCDAEFPTRAKLNEHKRDVHKNDPRIVAEKVKSEHTCRFCHKTLFVCDWSFTFHENHCECNPNRKVIKGHPVNDDTKLRISETCKKNKLSGGYRKGSGRGKKGTYKGYYCDSSWELAYVIYNLEHGIEFKRNTEKFPYIFEGEMHYYIPDFIEGDTYVEIKGFYTDQVLAKSRDFKFKLKFIDNESINQYLDYVIDKYGKDYIRLYEDKNYCTSIKLKLVECPCCHKLIHEDNLLHYMKCYKNKFISEERKQINSSKCQSDLNDLKSIYPQLSDINGRRLITSVDEYLRRKDLILNSGVDMTKFKWKSEVAKITGLHKRWIDGVVEKFPDEFKDAYKDAHVGKIMKVGG